MRHRRGETVVVARPPRQAAGSHHLPRPVVIVSAVLLVVIAVVVAIVRDLGSSGPRAQAIILPTAPRSYLGLYERGATSGYAGVDQFAQAIGRRPPTSFPTTAGGGEPFQTGFATTVTRHHGAVPLVQIDPTGITLKAIASGRYDAYLRGYADAVNGFQHPVILWFGHEMNAWWYSWGYPHASPAAFVAAWRHIVTLFRAPRRLERDLAVDGQRVGEHRPGRSGRRARGGQAGLVRQLGRHRRLLHRAVLDVRALFGPTIKAVRSADPRSGTHLRNSGPSHQRDQPAKIADLFAGTGLTACSASSGSTFPGSGLAGDRPGGAGGVPPWRPHVSPAPAMTGCC